ncbi:hypothetical protein DUNSADRAFT_17904 [Dunaliella salina]|uniref:Encoded protein n=1 Tax=Dunaliella salina TaxID=3046 RepID=A0ABQ7H8Z3_DUNSA|nr:hypothetical protein DUNSADRAFT_17904 [Dunaliella salina]|eukprot:KAF5843326.1 hypothetical protein DUNSADRAFT_17904 [Dunaliella salina]
MHACGAQMDINLAPPVKPTHGEVTDFLFQIPAFYACGTGAFNFGMEIKHSMPHTGDRSHQKAIILVSSHSRPHSGRDHILKHAIPYSSSGCSTYMYSVREHMFLHSMPRSSERSRRAAMDFSLKTLNAT